MGPNSSDRRRTCFIINEHGNAGHNIHSKKNIKNTNTSAMNSKYRACLAQKWEAHSFLPMVGGEVGGVRFISLKILK